MTTYTSQPNEASGYDTYLDSANPNSNSGSLTTLLIGETSGVVQKGRTLIKFDLSSIPSTATINSAVLSLWVKTDYSTNARNFKVYRVLLNWVELEATWNNWKTGTAWTTAGCGSAGNDFNPTVWATTAFAASESAGTEKQFDLDTTEFVKLIDGTYQNYGWKIQADTELNDAYQFYSSGEETFTERRPKLVVEYTDSGVVTTEDFFLVM